MAIDNQNATPEGGHKAEEDKALTEKIRLLSGVIIELNIARKKLTLYGSSHSLVSESIDRALIQLKKLLELHSPFVIGSAKKSLLVDNHVIGRNNPVFREFAEMLFEKGIVSVTFSAGVSGDEVGGLLEFLIAGAASSGRGDSPSVFSSAHILLKALDYKKIGFAEGVLTAESGAVWEQYVLAFLKGTLTSTDEDTFVMHGSPADIASFLNRQVKASHDPVSYDRIIAAYLRDKGGLRSAKMARFADLLAGMKPELRQRFLDIAVSTHPLDEKDWMQLIRRLPLEDMERLTGAVKTGEIPESIGNLFISLRKSGRESQYFHPISPGKAAVADFDIEINDNITGLFSNDRFSNFVSDGYRSELRRMMDTSEGHSSEFETILGRECTDEVIEKRFASLSVELFDAGVTTDNDVESLIMTVRSMSELFLTTGRFADFLDIYRQISRPRVFGISARTNEDIKNSLFQSGEFIEKCVTSIIEWGKYDRTGVRQLADALGPYLRIPLLDALAEEDESTTRKLLISLLKGMGPEVLSNAAERLDDTRWFVVRNMIYLIREMDGRGFASRIAPFIHSQNRRIALEAARTLIQFKAHDAASGIVKMLESEDLLLVEEAIVLTGMERLREAVPKLLAFLDETDPFTPPDRRRLAILKALNDIGDPRAVPHLVRIAGAKRFFLLHPNEKLLSAIFQNLGNYPFEVLGPLLDIGLKSDNKDIQAACKALLRKKEHAS